MSVGDRAEDADVRGTWGTARQRVKLRPSRRWWQSPLPILFWLCIFGGLVTAIVMVIQRGNREERQTAVGGPVTPPTEPRDPDITMTEVSPGVYHLEFGGWNCDDVQCLKRATGLVLERVPGQRIVSVAPIGAYGPSTTLVIVTAPVLQ